MEWRDGETFTIDGVYRAIPNPNRRWRQFWRPRVLVTDELATFTIKAAP